MSGNLEYDSRFTFTRIRYGSGLSNWRGGSWAHDYPRPDMHRRRTLDGLTNMRPRLEGSNVYDLDDPEVFLNPVIDISEPGFWTVSDSEAAKLRTYLLKGGFVISTCTIQSFIRSSR